MLTYDLDGRGKESRYGYLYTLLRRDIAEGRLKSGEKLPSKRALAERLGVSVITVENAYAMLVSEGYVQPRERSGYYVADAAALPPPPAAAKKPPARREETPPKTWRYDFSSTATDERYFPFSVWSRLMRETLSFGGEDLLRRSPNGGEWELREAIAGYLFRGRGIVAPPENIVVGAGTEYLYGLLVQLLGRGEVYGVETPSYQKISRIYEANGVKVCRLPLDKQGVRTDALAASPVSVLHVSPSHHYPTGVVTGFARRTELLAWANGKKGFIVEDDYDSEFRLVGKPISPLQALDRSGRVVYINTFSKTLAPSMRISYMVLPDGLKEKFEKKLGFYSCTVPKFEQLTLAKFLSRGYFERHLSRMRTVYRKKRDEAMRLFLSCGYPVEISEEDAGVHFLVKIRTDKSDDEVRALAEKQGAKLLFLSDFAEAGEEKTEHILVVNYSGLGRI